MRVLIVDDSRSSLAQLSSLLGQFDDVETAPFLDPEIALERAAVERFDLAIVDHIMPKVDGVTFIRQFSATPFHKQTPKIMLTASESDEAKMQALDAGATDFLSKSTRQLELTIRLRNIVNLARALRRLDDHVAAQALEIEAATRALLLREEEMVLRLSKALEYRDNDTHDHTYRVATYSRMIGEGLGLSARESRAVFVAAPLHDIGKVAIPDSILLKPGPLDEREREIMKSHAAIGMRILSGSQSELIAIAAMIAHSHHERWDGMGYPNGLAGEAIPICGRIVAVADAFDALTSERPYKKAVPLEGALGVLQSERGRHFDPACIDVFVAAVNGLAGSPPSLAGLREGLERRYPGLPSAAPSARAITPRRLSAERAEIGISSEDRMSRRAHDLPNAPDASMPVSPP